LAESSSYNIGGLIYGQSGFRFANLTGVDYSEGAIYLARGLADRDGFGAIDFLVFDSFLFLHQFVLSSMKFKKDYSVFCVK